MARPPPAIDGYPPAPHSSSSQLGLSRRSTTTTTKTKTSSSSSSNSNNSSSHDARAAADWKNDGPPAVVTASPFQPRVAVVLGVPKRWHPLLFACRLLPIAPALWWGLRCALRFMIADFLRRHAGKNGGPPGKLAEAMAVAAGASTCGPPVHRGEETRLKLIETALAIVWCGASAYLSFFFTDCLMSRWLLNYTPQATLVRLVSLAATFAYITSWTVYLVGADRSPSLLLPAWIGIATTLTVLYHATQRKINIRKETSASISVFSIASFASMVALLIHLALARYEGRSPFASSTVDNFEVPLVTLIRRGASISGQIVVAVLGVNRERDGL